jgi:alpha-galactosidase
MYSSTLRYIDLHASSGARRTVVAQPWHTIGPFQSPRDSSFTESFAPEHEILLDRTYSDGKLRWIEKPAWRDGEIIPLPPVDFSSSYMYRLIEARRDTSLQVFFGSDDGIKVWLNDSLILAKDVERGCAPNQETGVLHLRRGENRLLMKINNGEGPCAFYFSLERFFPRDLWPVVERNFPDTLSRLEIRRERSAGLWPENPVRFDLETLASSYVAATHYETPEARAKASLETSKVRAWSDLAQFRKKFHESIQDEFVILTPPSPLTPRITGPSVYGARPGSPFLFTITATGQKPMEFSAAGLPPGLLVDGHTGRITGTLSAPGEYLVTVRATNLLGSSDRLLRIKSGKTIALTPPLGWNSWNCFADAVNDRRVRSAADAMVSTGLLDHGWSYINIDDCWMVRPNSQDLLLGGAPRDRNGMINSNGKFPDMKSLSDYVHAKGLKFGIYSSPGPLTCAGYTACYRFERQDAQRFADWGVDYLKYDWCSYGSIAKDHSLSELMKPYQVMRAALDSVHRDILYSLCQYGMGNVWEWGAEVGGNCWRTTGDITDTWNSMSGIGFSQDGHERWAGPGHWNDPDMLVVGMVGWGESLHPTSLSGNEQYTHISLWALLDAPLLIGCDMAQMDAFTLGLLTNDEVLEVNQDPLGMQARRVYKDGDVEIWAKEMSDSSRAVGLFNRGEYTTKASVRWVDVRLTGTHRVRDLWRQKDLGAFESAFASSVPRHGVVLVRIF